KREGTGLEYKRHRYYDPTTGRFTQPDPIGLAGGLNLYGFANGDPVNFSDPFGLVPLPLILWGMFELGSALYDVYETTQAFRSSSAEGAEALQATLMGAIAPGPGNFYRKAANAAGRFAKAGIETAEPHFSRRLAGRESRGITGQNALDAYNRGRVFYDPESGRYIRHDSKTGVSIVVTKPSGGKAITVFEGAPSPDWVPIRWRP
ncbi:MAG: RHS repeat-associated core domain-containing protein, partial [Gemmatimonadales bacterium]|nr:RHS repeat-associated core domain-containing protein [Gemmatimonadales bacterium]